MKRSVNSYEVSTTNKNTKNNKSFLGLIPLFIFIVIFFVIVFGGESDESVNGDQTTTNATGTEAVAETTAEEVPAVLYEDDFFAIEYMDVFDNDYVTCSYLQLKVTNKSDQKVTLSLDDVYVNDISIQSGSGMPIELEPGKVSQTPFVLFTGNTELKADDITKIEFALNGRNDDFETVHTTNKIIIER